MSDSNETLKQRIQADMKTAMKAGEKARLGTIRLLLAAIKQREVDERIVLDDAQVLLVLDKMVKQRRESITQYEQASRDDLAQVERDEMVVLLGYLPEQLTSAGVDDLIRAAIAETNATGVRDMGKVMNALRPKLQGRADMAEASSRVKQLLEHP